ncbi:MAG: hypothetical protein ACR2I2_03890 [Bryobacteraceae bacterium]
MRIKSASSALAFRADGEAIHIIPRQGELQSLIGLVAQPARAQNLHPDNAFSRRLHLFQHAEHGCRFGIHGNLGHSLGRQPGPD